MGHDLTMVASKVMAESTPVDFLVMGGGVAGLRAAIELARYGEVLVVTKESLGESNTHYAQGGIAVAMEGHEDIALHLEDTINAGDGLVYRPAAEVMVAEGPVRVAELIEWGAAFDTESGELLRTREGAHSLPRILHAHGDATGAEISRSLVAFARARMRIRFSEWTMVTGLVVADGRVIGADLARADVNTSDWVTHRVSARAVLIAAGGGGQVYSETTNPAVATGDGIAIAAQAGADLADMEFYQFHPTALSLPGVPRFLISEALRGEGAYLRNDKGERFMERYHPLLELAPRDVVARAIAREEMSDEPGHPRLVHLDIRHVQGLDVHHRFPCISAFLARFGLDLARDPIPIRPAAHYLMGGIKTDLSGRSSLPGLYAAGEAACTGVHGANRLASNSLLEGLVFGARAARAMLADDLPLIPVADQQAATIPLSDAESEFVEVQIAGLRHAMWICAGLLRDESSLRDGFTTHMEISTRLAELASKRKGSRRLSEAHALTCVSYAILYSAFHREESRGAHFRNDFPKRDDEHFKKHSKLTVGGFAVPDQRFEFEPW